MTSKDSTPDTRDGVPEPTDDEFADWCQNPVTRYVAKAFKVMAEDEKTRWVNNTWNAPVSTPDVERTLATVKATVQAYEVFINAKKEHYVRTNSRAAKKSS